MLLPTITSRLSQFRWIVLKVCKCFGYINRWRKSLRIPRDQLYKREGLIGGDILTCLILLHFLQSTWRAEAQRGTWNERRTTVVDVVPGNQPICCNGVFLRDRLAGVIGLDSVLFPSAIGRRGRCKYTASMLIGSSEDGG